MLKSDIIKIMNKIKYEIETKILDVDKNIIKEKMQLFGAKEVLNTRLFVDWFGPKNFSHKSDEDPWFLRIRTDNEGNSELTWKSARNFLGASSKHKEINLKVLDKNATSDLLIELGMELYAHQEKDRISWIYKDWSFDLDQYPNMPAYLEIEGKSEESIQEAIKLLNLEDKMVTPKGETTIIKNDYSLDWYNMKF